MTPGLIYRACSVTQCPTGCVLSHVMAIEKKGVRRTRGKV